MSLAGMSPFASRFRDVAARETRVIMLAYSQGGLPAGSYGFLELYCLDPACECKRVLLQVCEEREPEKVLATINYGWESLAFYTKWLRGDQESAREIKEASLDPINLQTSYAPTLLRLFQTVILQDKAYIKRLKRHYVLFKSSPSPSAPTKPPSGGSQSRTVTRRPDRLARALPLGSFGRKRHTFSENAPSLRP